MQKYLSLGMSLLFASSILAGTANAQQTTSTTHKTSTAKKTTGSTKATAKSAPATGTKPLVLTTQKEKQSYAIGLNLGAMLHERDLLTPEDVDPKILLQGFEDALADRKAILTDDEIKTTVLALQQDLRKRMEAKFQALLQKNKQEGQEFLAANGKKEGVVTLPSGLQYKILKEGTGPKPTATDTVLCNYRGTLLDNTEFDSSYKRGQPASIDVSHVIKGWTEALQLMPVGSKWQLFIPADLAYGDRGQGPIGPGSTLIFDVELLSIQAKPAQSTQPSQPAQTPQPAQQPAQSTPTPK